MKNISKYKFVFYFLNSIIMMLLLSCNQTKTHDNKEVTEIKSNNKILAPVNSVFNTLPSPIETSKLISKSNVKFNSRILNPVKNVPYYESSNSLALNLGIYCADMSYTSYYNQKQLTLEYLTAIKTLADNLGIINLMDKNDILLLEDNIFNQDSIRIILKDIFLSSGKYLNNNNQPELALLIEVGGWIEGLNIAMQLATQSIHINKELVDRIIEQRESLKLVIKSLELFSDYETIYNIHKDMLSLQTIYNKTIIPNNDTISNKPDNLVKNTKANVTPEIFINLYKEINKIRNSYTQ